MRTDDTMREECGIDLSIGQYGLAFRHSLLFGFTEAAMGHLSARNFPENATDKRLAPATRRFKRGHAPGSPSHGLIANCSFVFTLYLRESCPVRMSRFPRFVSHPGSSERDFALPAWLRTSVRRQQRSHPRRRGGRPDWYRQQPLR